MALADYVAAVQADSPAAWYKLDEASGLFQDTSGAAKHMTNTSGTILYQQAGPFSGAVAAKFADVAGQNTTAGTFAITATNNFTMESWVKFETFSGDATTFLGNNNGGTNGYVLVRRTGDKLAAVSQGVAFEANSSASLSTSAFQHWVVTRDAGTWKYYLNGAVDTANAGTDTPTAPSGAGATFLWAGGGNVGWLSHVAFYSTALSLARVSAHYNAAFSVSLLGQYVARHAGRGSAW